MSLSQKPSNSRSNFKRNILGDTVEIFPCPFEKVEHKYFPSSKSLSFSVVRGEDGNDRQLTATMTVKIWIRWS